MNDLIGLLKNTVKIVVLPGILWFLIGAFYCASFDVSTWSPETKYTISMMFIASIIIVYYADRNWEI